MPQCLKYLGQSITFFTLLDEFTLDYVICIICVAFMIAFVTKATLKVLYLYF